MARPSAGLVAAWIGTAFAQDDAAGVSANSGGRSRIKCARAWRNYALMDDAEADVLAYMGFPAQHRAKIH